MPMEDFILAILQVAIFRRIFIMSFRFCLRGKDVLFICGSDEHGVPITIRARKENCTPQEIVDKYHELMKRTFVELGINFSIYSRTSSEVHHKTASDFFRKLYNKGIFTESITEQYYDEKAGQFLADRYITGTCPNCGNPNAYGDQCEKCGTSLSPLDLINPVSTLSGEKPILKETKNWFLPLDKLQPKIEEYINSHSDWKPNVFGQCKSWLNQGLQPRAMTRDLDWGVKVPLPDSEGKVLYVWFDAPIGYISANQKNLLKDWEKNIGKTRIPALYSFSFGKIISYSIALSSLLCLCAMENIFSPIMFLPMSF